MELHRFPTLRGTAELIAFNAWLEKLMLYMRAIQTSIGTIVTDHGGLAGLTDDDHLQYLLTDGTRQLSANWDAGSYEIRAETFESDVATGTAPFTVASTTLVTNLNADYLDGKHASEFLYLDQTTPQTIANGIPLMTETVDAYGSGDQLINLDYIRSGEWLFPPIIEWWDPVAEGGLPADPEVGDRYGADGTGYGWTYDYIYEWDGEEWVEYPPEEGWMLWCLLDLIFYAFFSGGWMEVGSGSYWSLEENQMGIKGDKSGIFNITTTGDGLFGRIGVEGTWDEPTYTYFQGGTQATDVTYTLPVALPASVGFLKSTDAGVMSWDTNVYLTEETDPVFSSADCAAITSTQILNWDTAYGWGDHSGEGYLTSLAFSGLTDYPADAAGALTNDGAGNLSWAAAGGASALDELSDVDVTDIANGKILQYNSGTSKWECESLAGGGDLKADGTVPLTANWDVGDFKITCKIVDIESAADETLLLLTSAGMDAYEALSIRGTASSTTGNGKAFSVGVIGASYATGMFYTDGSYGIGAGTGSRDVYIFRSAANTVKISSDRSTGAGHLVVTGAIEAGTNIVATSKFALGAAVTTDKAYFYSASDTSLAKFYSPSQTANALVTYQLPAATGTSDGKAFQIIAGSESYARMIIYSLPAIGMGGGTATRDVYIRRYAANTLMIDVNIAGGAGGDLLLTGGLNIGGTADPGNGNLVVSGGATVTGTVAAGTVTGANVTSGADPGHTHTAYLPVAHQGQDVSNLKISRIAADASVITVTYDILQVGQCQLTSGNFAIDADGGTGALKLDKGSLAADTWYYIWVICKAAGADPTALISLSATTPTLPANYLYQRRVGSCRATSTSAIREFFTNSYNVHWYGERYTPLSAGTQAAYTDVDLSTYLPPTSTTATLNLESTREASANGITVKPKGISTSARYMVQFIQGNGATKVTGRTSAFCPTDENQTIQYFVTSVTNNGSGTIYLMGYADNL